MTDDDILRRASEAYLAGDDALCESLAREAGDSAQALRLRKRARRFEAALDDAWDRFERG